MATLKRQIPRIEAQIEALGLSAAAPVGTFLFAVALLPCLVGMVGSPLSLSLSLSLSLLISLFLSFSLTAASPDTKAV